MLQSGPLRVGYVVKRYPRYSETFIVNEILAHEAAGLDVEIFSLRPPCDTHFQDRIARVRAPVRYLAVESTRAAGLWRTLGRAAEILPDVWQAVGAARHEDISLVHQALLLACHMHDRGITHLHAHFATEATTVARLAARFAGATYSFTAHAKDIYHEDASFEDRRDKLQDAAGVVTVSDYNLRYLRETFGAAALRVRRIYNGLELDEFSYKPPRDRAPLIVAVGRLVEKKGFDDLVQACALLADAGTEFRCRIIGTGELEQDLRRRIRELGLEDRVEMLGPRPQAEVIRLVQEAAVFAAPCVVGRDGNRDGLPTVLLEAMALGTPCVSTDVTGIPEIIRDSETGAIVAQRDPASLAGAVGRLLADPPLRIRLAEQARGLVEREFDIHRNAAAIREMFCQAIEAESCNRGAQPAALLQEIG